MWQLRNINLVIKPPLLRLEMTSSLNIAACIQLIKKELGDLTKSETGEIDNAGGREPSVSEDMINIPSPIPELDELIQNDAKVFNNIIECIICTK